MKLDGGSREIGTTSRGESSPAGEHGMCQVRCQAMVSIAQAPSIRHSPEHTCGHVYVYVRRCVYGGRVLTGGQYTHADPRSH